MFVRAFWAVSFSFALVASAIPARPADALPTAAEIATHVRDAAGPAIPAYREVVDSSSNGIAIHSVTLRSGRDYREETDSGPFHTARGSIGGQAWRQNENGETILMQADPGRAAPDVVTGSVARIASPVDGYVVSALDVRGDGVKKYVDAATWHVVRVDLVVTSGTTVTTFDDFRTVAGHTAAFHFVSSDGHPENDLDSRVSELAPLAIDHNALAVPNPRRILVEFPTGETSVQLPVREDAGKFIVRVDVGSRGLDFVLDSGASGIFMEDATLKQLGLSSLQTVSNGANAGRFRQAKTIVPSMKVGELTMHDVVVSSVPSVNVAGVLGDYRAVGLLGFDFIDGVALKLDYSHGKATAYDPSAFKAPDDSNGFNTDLRLGTGAPLVTVTVNGAVGERFMLDSGSFGSLIILDYFVRRNQSALVDEGAGARAAPLRIQGIGGTVEAKAYQLREVQFGKVRFHDFLAYAIQDRTAYDTGLDGTVGPAFLKLFDVYLDYRDARAYFVFAGS